MLMRGLFGNSISKWGISVKYTKKTTNSLFLQYKIQIPADHHDLHSCGEEKHIRSKEPFG
jgi:hypothetical protein